MDTTVVSGRDRRARDIFQRAAAAADRACRGHADRLCDGYGGRGVHQDAQQPHRRARHRQKGGISRARGGGYGGGLSDHLGAGAHRYPPANQLLLRHDHHDLADHQRASLHTGKPRRVKYSAAVVSRRCGQEHEGQGGEQGGRI